VKECLERAWDEGASSGKLASRRFPSPEVCQVLNAVSQRVARLVNNDTGSGGNCVLHGPEGVGKTSILRALEYGLRGAYPGVEVRLLSLERPVRSMLGDDSAEVVDASSIVWPTVGEWEKKIGEKKGLVLLVDEVQYLYCLDCEENRKASFTLVSLARLKNVFVLLTGSTAKLDKLLYHSTPPSPEQRSYANFNETLFSSLFLSPARTCEAIRSAVAAWGGDVAKVADCFAKTGGVGRTVRFFCEGDFGPRPIYVRASGNRALFRVVMLLFARNRSNRGLPWTQVRATTSELILAIGGSEEEALQALFGFLDSGILYHAEDGWWEFFFPAHLAELEQAASSNESFKLDLALHAVLVGFDEGSAGAALEEWVLRWCVEADLIDKALPFLRVNRLSKIDECLCRLLRVDNDHGADAALLRKRGGKYFVQLFQVKLGKADSSGITYGGAGGAFGTVPTMYCIIRRAIVAAAQLRLLFPDADITVTELVIITSKNVEKKVLKKARNEKLWNIVEQLVVENNAVEMKDAKTKSKKVAKAVKRTVTRLREENPDITIIGRDVFYREVLPAHKRIMLFGSPLE
jgi:hypothetical protein